MPGTLAPWIKITATCPLLGSLDFSSRTKIFTPIAGGDMEITPRKFGRFNYVRHNKSKGEEAGQGNSKAFHGGQLVIEEEEDRLSLMFLQKVLRFF
jgi:hypothetical protein